MNRSLLALLAVAVGPALAAQAQETGQNRPARIDGEAFQAPSPQGEAGAPAESAPPETSYKPLLPNQTRAPQPARTASVDITPVATGLASAWALEFLPDGRMIVTEKEGRIRIVGKDGKLGQPVSGVPKVDARGQGGLLDIALSPGFSSDRTLYFSYSEPREKGNGTTVAKAKLSEKDGGGKLEEFKVIFRQTPTYEGDKHYGSRLVFAPDGKLFVTVGDRFDTAVRGQAQELTSGLGKVFRIDTEGAAPKDNPFTGGEKAIPEIWSYGHRNTQSAALDGQGRLWTVEHGPRGGDELNRPRPGLNYGWPVVSYGIEYTGGKVGDGQTRAGGTVQPVYYWDPVIGPSGMAYYDADLLPDWKGTFIIGGLAQPVLAVLKIQDDKVVTEERVQMNARIRDVKTGPDGAVYAVTDGPDGSILKVTPKKGS